MRHVIAAASNNLEFSRRNTDKLVIHFTILAGLAVLLVQFALMALAMTTAPSFAWPWWGRDWQTTFVVTPYGPSQDIALIMLDRVFGVMDIFGAGTGFFGSCYSTPIACLDIAGRPAPDSAVFPSPFHIALHQMLWFYSLGIAFISLVVILYFVMTTIGETITTGTPFGQRFNKAWFVPRLIVFFALIAPLNGVSPGINGAQFITLGVAKYGSNMATNAWANFAGGIRAQYAVGGVTTLFGDKGTLVAFPNVPSVSKLNQFMYLVRMCMYAEKILNNVEIRPYLVREMDMNPFKHMGYTPYVNWLDYFTTDFDDALEFSRYGNVVLRFGELNMPDAATIEQVVTDFGLVPGNHNREWGHVKPTCGEITFEVSAADPIVAGPLPAPALGIQENYYLSIEEYISFDPTYDLSGYCMVRAILPYDHDPTCVDNTVIHNFNAGMWAGGGHGVPGAFPNVTANTEWLTRELAKNSISYYDALNKFYINGNFTVAGATYTGTTANPYFTNSTIGQLRLNYDFNIPIPIMERGWVAMSAYYRQIADLNGLIFSAVQNMPAPTKYPFVMELIAQQHDSSDTVPNLGERFNPLLQSGKLADLPRPGDQYIAAALYSGYRFWADDNLAGPKVKKESGNAVMDAINAIFGTEGLFNMLNNNDVHPLAQLSALGRSMLEASIRNIFVGSTVGLVSDIIEKKFQIGIGPLPKVAGDFASKIGMVGISIGFMLYYVLPLLPFVYFFFAFSGWVKAIFEAVVAMPLWALAHIKTDGQGLPGPLATNGYFLLFEIFLRPTLIVFGFLASITIFTAAVNTFNGIYELVVLNVSGYDLKENIYRGPIAGGMGSPTLNFLRGPIDQLFYTAIYAIIVYMMALSSFKLIDQIPASILRYMGVTVSTFKNVGDPGGELYSRMSRTSQITKAQLNTAEDQIKGVGAGRDQIRDVINQQSLLKK